MSWSAFFPSLPYTSVQGPFYRLWAACTVPVYWQVAFTGKSHAQYAVVESLGLGPFKLPSTAAVEDPCLIVVTTCTHSYIHIQAPCSPRPDMYSHPATLLSTVPPENMHTYLVPLDIQGAFANRGVH